MKVLIKDIKDIMSDELSLTERGILLTIIFLKDYDDTLTLGKVRAKININKYRLELINLHEGGFIEWSGYKNTKKKLDAETFSEDVQDIIRFMNNLYKRNFSHKSKRMAITLGARIKEVGVETVKKVIANRYVIWNDDPVMSQYLRPCTIFRSSNFDKYLEEANRTKEGSSFVNAQKITIKAGEELCVNNATQLIDDDIYSVKVYDNYNDKKINLRKHTMSGKQIKNLVRSEDKRVKRGELKENFYILNL